jgi:hypothetical protein
MRTSHPCTSKLLLIENMLSQYQQSG